MNYFSGIRKKSHPIRIRTFLLGFEENSLKSCCCKSRSSCLGDWPDGTARNGVSAVAGELTGSALTPAITWMRNVANNCNENMVDSIFLVINWINRSIPFNIAKRSTVVNKALVEARIESRWHSPASQRQTQRHVTPSHEVIAQKLIHGFVTYSDKQEPLLSESTLFPHSLHNLEKSYERKHFLNWCV